MKAEIFLRHVVMNVLIFITMLYLADDVLTALLVTFTMSAAITMAIWLAKEK